MNCGRIRAASAALLAATLMGALLASPAAARVKPGPIDVAVTVDAARSATATVTADGGGSLTVTAPNGTRIAITFPSRSVLEDTKITATPVARLTSRARVLRKGLLAGVQLQPEGLQLVQPATVRFTRRGRAAKRTQLVFLGTQGTGKGVHQLPPPVRFRGRGKARRVVAAKTPAVQIRHFSTVEAFDFSTATIDELNQILRPGLGVDRLTDEIARLIREGATVSDLVDALERGRTRLVTPVVNAAISKLESKCSEPSIRYSVGAMRLAISLQRQLETIGGSDAETAPLALAVKLLRLTASCMTTLCPTLGDPRAGQYFASIAHQLALIGGASDAYYDALLENMTRCGAFEVHIDSTQDHLSPEFHWSLHVDGRVKVVPRLDIIAPPRPRGPLTYVSATGGAPGECFSAEIRKTGNGEIELTDLQFSPYDPERPTANPVISMKLTVTVPPTETYHQKSTPQQEQCSLDEPPDYDAQLWFLGFQSQHLGFTFPGRDFLRDAAPKFALAVYSPNAVQLINGSVTENTLVEIIHTPQPPVPLTE